MGDFRSAQLHAGRAQEVALGPSKGHQGFSEVPQHPSDGAEGPPIGSRPLQRTFQPYQEAIWPLQGNLRLPPVDPSDPLMGLRSPPGDYRSPSS